MSPDSAKATFVTFYSFKGGVGRSMALINTAGILAGRRGFRVLVLDLDLEAPGLSYLDPKMPDVASALAQRELPLQVGFVDLLTDAKERAQEADLFALSSRDLECKYTQAINIPDTLREFADGSLRIMPAGRFDRDYAQRLDALNLSALYRDGLGEPLIRAFKKKFAEAGLYDYVLVDSRTGISEGAGICTRDLADHVMILSGLNRQNVEGTCEFLRQFRAATEGKKGLQIVLSPIPNGEDALLEERREMAAQAFKRAWGAEVDLSLEIPYHPQLALTEEPHIFRRRRGYLFEAYRAIEAAMLTTLGHLAETLQQEVVASLNRKEFAAALRGLGHMIRLDQGQESLSRLAFDLASPQPSRRRPERESTQPPISLVDLLADPDGRSVAEFIVTHLSVGKRSPLLDRLIHVLGQQAPNQKDRLLKRILTFEPGDPDTLGGYAVILESSGDLEAAELFYQRAVQVNPKHANNLGNYADFLEHRRGELDAAESFYRRAIEADPENATNLGNFALFVKNRRADLELAEALFNRAVKADPKHTGNLGNYAVFLEYQRGDADAAEMFYTRALEVDSKHANNLGNFALFVKNRRGDLEFAEALFKRALEADPKHAGNLGNYAVFLEYQRGAMDAAETFYKRAVEALPTHASTLVNYAVFLENRRGDIEAAEHYYKCAIEADPKRAATLGNYANFLANRRGNLDAAETFYKRAVDADPKNPISLCNYGQFLAGVGRFADGEGNLLQAFALMAVARRREMAEICLTLWLVIRMQGRTAEDWERRFKFLVDQGFERCPWNFDRLIMQAEARLVPDELDYAKALTAAYLDEQKANELVKFPRWQALDPLEPKAAGTDPGS